MERDEGVVMMLKLKPGWALDKALPGFRQRRESIAVMLPRGARLLPALRIDTAHHPTPAERELARFVHLHWPDPSEADHALATARGWPCVERAEIIGG